MSNEKINVVNTSKGSAFFVDLDKVIQEESKEVQKQQQEKQANGTTLFIPLFDNRSKNKAKSKGKKSTKLSIPEKNNSLNRTFTKEDFESLRKIEKVQDQNNGPEKASQDIKNIDVQSVLEHNEIIAPLLDILPPQGHQIEKSSSEKLRQRSSTSPGVHKDVKTFHFCSKKLKDTINNYSEMLDDLPIGNSKPNGFNIQETCGWEKTQLPHLPNWATGKNLSLDSTILNLRPFPEPVKEETVEEDKAQKISNKNNDSNNKISNNDKPKDNSSEGNLKIEDMFPTSKQPAKKYNSAVLPAISRGTAALSAAVNKTSPSSPKRKKQSSAKSSSKIKVTKPSSACGSKKPASSNKPSTARKNNGGKKKSKAKKKNKETVIDQEVNDLDNIESVKSVDKQKEMNEILITTTNTSLDKDMIFVSTERNDADKIEVPIVLNTIDSDNIADKPNYDSIFDFYEYGNIKSLVLSGDQPVNPQISSPQAPQMKEIHLTKEVLEKHNTFEKETEVISTLVSNTANYLANNLQNSLAIEGEPTLQINKPLLFPPNNFLSKISEEQTYRSTIKSRLTMPENNDSHNSSKVKIPPLKHKSLSFGSESSMSIDGQYDIDEMTRLVFQPNVASHSSIGNTSDISDGLSSGRQYLRSVLGSCRSVYSRTSTEVSGNNDSEVIEWQKGKIIDRGAFGIVYQGLTSRAQLIAVKEVQVTESKNKEKNYVKLQNEIGILKGLRHRNIIKFIGTSLEEDVVYIFMEYIAGGSLAGLITSFGPLKEAIFQRYTKQIMSAVFYLHTNSVIHRDIKGANILITVKGSIKLIDFGCAKELSLSLGATLMLKSVKGTPYWMAPEVIQGTGCNHKSDVWSVGCTVMEMATGKPPWSEYTPYAAMYAIAEHSNEPPGLTETYSENARTFVSCCLTRDMDERPSAEDLLVHPFICM